MTRHPYTPTPPEAVGVGRRSGGIMGAIGRWIAPQVRGRVDQRIIDHWRSQGWHVHQVGQAAYVHKGDCHLIFGVWGKRDPRPRFADRLGGISAAYARRYERCVAEQSWRRQLRRKTGQFGPRLPWYRWPTPRLYSFVDAGPSPWEADELRALQDNRRIRERLGLVAPTTELELRAMWGDR